MALDNKKIGADRVVPPTITAMVMLLNAKEAHWLHMLLLDVNLAEYGAYMNTYDEYVGGARGGTLQLGDSGFLYIGSRKPKSGNNHAYTVIEEDLDFACPGIDRFIKGGAGPREWTPALDQRDTHIEERCPSHCPEVI